ncbi:MAG: TIGR00268 family protein, partial [Synechocystis sp.]|nr:TIGR00268 family protein [Synechocystis sp.]
IQVFMQAVSLPELVKTFQDLGFTYVTLDLEGYQSGKLNRVLSNSVN